MTGNQNDRIYSLEQEVNRLSCCVRDLQEENNLLLAKAIQELQEDMQDNNLGIYCDYWNSIATLIEQMEGRRNESNT